MKKGMLMAISFLMVFTFSTPIFAHANEKPQTSVKPQSASEVFEQEEVDKLVQKIHKKNLTADKSPSIGSFREAINAIRPRSTGEYPTRKGIILVTGDAYKGLIPTGHAGIIYGANTVVESLSGGVTTGDNNWNTTKKSCYAVTVKGTNAEQDKAAANWCHDQINKPYNWNYFDTGARDKFYCSQLVWAAFLDNFGIDLNTNDFFNAIHPLELVSTDETRLVYEK